MPFWSCALLSGLLFVMGLVAFLVRRTGAARAMSMTLMLQGALLLLVASATRLQHLGGQGAALLVLGLVPAEYVVSLLLWDKEGRG